MRLERKACATYNPGMQVGVAQINSQVGAIDRNLEMILSHIAEAKRAECDLVIFPELALCGTPFGLACRTGFADRIKEALQAIMVASNGIGVIVGAVSSSQAQPTNAAPDHKLLNSAFLIADGSLIGEQAKLTLQPCSETNEACTFAPGPGAQVFGFHEKLLGINIGEDLWSDDGPTDTQAGLGAELIINVTTSRFAVGKAATHRQLATRRAKDNGITLVVVNLVGGQDELVFDGGSFIVGPGGDLLYQAPYFAEGLFIADLDELSPIPAPTDDPIDLVRRAIILGIHDYVRKNGFGKVLVGLSGGIDSALVAALAVEALGAEVVTGVFLPSAITSQESHEDALDVARRLSIELLEVPIEEVAIACRNALPNEPTGLVDENLQARARGILLMALANERHALVLATGNKSEIAMGYNTLYGDTVGALAPIADLYKSEVYRLVTAFGDCIPSQVVGKAPSAELRPGQRDEDDLYPYSILDPLLHELIEQNASREELIAQGFSEPVVNDVLTRYFRSEYKRRQSPPAIRVSAKGLRSDGQMPITHAYDH